MRSWIVFSWPLLSESNSSTNAISARYSSQLLVKMPPSLLLSE
ncbi:hypothetical protein Y695_04864 [Hydrogenophaga sp. T4]|nr:hypothetical protein Y695_04864 [Hydrogenophaga sp. T4]